MSDARGAGRRRQCRRRRKASHLFLTATPHNGHSNSFSALLEMLDPQRFTRGVEVRPRRPKIIPTGNGAAMPAMQLQGM
jgi:hypothetical protein